MQPAHTNTSTTMAKSMVINVEIQIENTAKENVKIFFLLRTFMSYVFTHADWPHYLNNLVLQLVLGIPLESVHGFFRVGTIYLLSGAGAGLYR